jgi:hypothetical protein
MRMTREEWTVEHPGDSGWLRIGDLVTISNGKRKVTTIVCKDHTGTCDACCIKDVFGPAACVKVPIYCMGLCFKLVEDMV